MITDEPRNQLLEFMQKYHQDQEAYEQKRYETLKKLGGEEFEQLQFEMNKKQLK